MSDIWYDPECKYPHEQLIPRTRDLMAALQERRKAYEVYARMYSDSLLDVFGGSYSHAESIQRRDRLQMNVVKACVSTLHSKMRASPPKSQFFAEMANHEQRMRAEAQDLFVAGQKYEMGADAVHGQILFDALVYGNGFGWFDIDPLLKRMTFERVYPWQLFVDDLDGYDDHPRELIRLKFWDKRELAMRFPEYKDDIMAGGIDIERHRGYNRLHPTRIAVVYGIHLPSGPKADDGRYTMCIDGQTLIDEPYTRTVHPLVRIKWEPETVGFYGDGVPKNLLGTQVMINRTLRDIQRAQSVMARPHWLVPNGAQVPGLDNDIGSIIRYGGLTPPQAVTPQAMTPEIYSFLEYCWSKSFQLVGLSEMSATSVKPPGLNSGKALNEYHDIGTLRFAAFARADEELENDISRQIVYFASQLPKSYVVRATSGTGYRNVKWSEAALEDRETVVKAFPMSAFSSNPVEKRQEVTDLVDKGWLTQDVAFDLIEFPDVSQYMRRKTAPRRAIQRFISDIVNHGIYEPPPESILPVDMALREAVYAYWDAAAENVPEDRLEKLLLFITRCTELQAKKNPAPTGAPGPMPGMPPGPEQLSAPGGVASVPPPIPASPEGVPGAPIPV